MLESFESVISVDYSSIHLLHFFITNFIDAEDSCLWKKDGFASDHKTYEGFTTKYGENWLEIHDWKWCDKTCEELAALNYCELAWKDVLHCSAIDNLKVEDTCKRSCDKKCRKYLIFRF